MMERSNFHSEGRRDNREKEDVSRANDHWSMFRFEGRIGPVALETVTLVCRTRTSFKMELGDSVGQESSAQSLLHAGQDRKTFALTLFARSVVGLVAISMSRRPRYHATD